MSNNSDVICEWCHAPIHKYQKEDKRFHRQCFREYRKEYQRRWHTQHKFLAMSTFIGITEEIDHEGRNTIPIRQRTV